jgi:farnesyl-diphosphate farnesyltransferase
MPSHLSLNELLHAASRTFALGIDMLPEPLRSEIETAYLVLRVSDYLEDNESMDSDDKALWLEQWADALDANSLPPALQSFLESCPDDTPDALVARSVRRVHEALARLDPNARSIIAHHTADSTRGMARWARRGSDFPDEPALDDYMHEVAGRVGWLLTDLFALRVPGVATRRDDMMALGREFGLALQTVNVIRGLHDDWTRGWVFVPRSFVGDRDPLPAALVDGSATDATAAGLMVDQLVRKAEGHLEAARRYLSGLPRRAHRVRLFCMLPWLFAVRTLAISRANPNVLTEETKITRDEVRRIASAAQRFGWSNLWLRWYSARLAHAPNPAAQRA